MKPLKQDKEIRMETPTAKKNRRGRRWLTLLALIGCFLIVAVAGGGYYVYQGLQPVKAQGQVKQVTIPPGSSVRDIAGILKNEGLIKNSTLFTYYAKVKGIGNRLQAGEYHFEAGQSIDQLLNSMVNGDSVIETARFTIPEGLNVEQIASSLEKKGLVDKVAFLREVNQGSFPEFPFIGSIPQKEGRKYRLEGYLFPETYEVKKDATEHEIIAKMLYQFQKELKPEWVQNLKQRSMSIDDAVNLAAIVEREVVVDTERPVVAGVFYNRIRDNWMLQSCATVQFVLGKQRDLITFDDLKTKSPYNTYINEGLPPGPIASPGRASLAAVAEPVKHDYFFFVTKKDGTSEHFFSKTLEEHLSKDAKSRGNW